MRQYSLQRFAGDCFGGIIAALIALPYGLAMASMMGLPPALGIFCSVITAPVTAMLGRNPVLIGGASTVTVPFIAAAVSAQGVGGAAKVTIVAGVFLMVFCVLRLGRHLAKIPTAVVSGFSCGIGIMMVLTQIRTLSAMSGPEPYLLALVVVILSAGFANTFPRLPAPLAAVFFAALLAKIYGWQPDEVGRLVLELPPFASFSWTPRDVVQVLPSAFGLAVVSAANLLITSRVVYHFLGDHARQKLADNDRELGAYGIANLVSGIFGAPMSVGIPARSLANVRCGGTTRWSNALHALFLAGFLALGSEWISHIPVAALCGVTAWIGLFLLDWSTWRRLPKLRRSEAAAFLFTAVGVPLINPVVAATIGTFLHYAPRLLDLVRERPQPASDLLTIPRSR
jgi:SulP family sulfate permease